jgi:hypothetical protein
MDSTLSHPDFLRQCYIVGLFDRRWLLLDTCEMIAKYVLTIKRKSGFGS